MSIHISFKPEREAVDNEQRRSEMNTARFLAVIVLALVVGFVGYQIGIEQNVGVAVPAAGAPVAYYGYPYHFGFGFLGFLFPLFFLFLIFGLLRAAFGGWGHRRYGYGNWQGGPWMSDEAKSRIEQLHKELHGEKPASGGGGPSSTST
jgi:hypothetical protein